MKISVWAWAAIIQDRKILLTKRAKTKGIFPNFWTFASWRFDESDPSIEATAIREVKEEIGLDFVPTSKLNFYESSKNDLLMVSHIYLWTRSGIIVIQEEEVSDYWRYTYTETKDLEIAFAYNEVIQDLKDLELID